MGVPHKLQGQNFAWIPSWPHLVIFFGAVYGAAYGGIELSRAAERVAAIWPANAIVLAVLLRSVRARWPAYLVFGSLANFSADLTAGDAPIFGLALTLCNVAEILVAAVAVRSPWGVKTLSFTSTQTLLRFCLLCGALAPAVSATLAAAFLSYAHGLPLASTWLTWFAADALGMVIIAPVLISINKKHLSELLRQGRAAEAVIGSLVICAVVVFVFSQTVYPLTYLCIPLLIVGAFRFGFLGAAWGLLLTAAASVSLTAHGSAPFALTNGGSKPEEILLLQAFLLVLTFTALTVGVILEKRKAAETALLAAQEETVAIMEHTIDGLVTFDQNGMILNINGPAERIFGQKAGEIVGRDIGALLPDLHLDGGGQSRSATNEGDPVVPPGFGQELVARRSDGSEFAMDLAIGEIRGDPGDPWFVATVRDVSKRKRTEEALRLSEDRLDQAIRVSDIGIFDHDQKTDTIYWSPRQREIYGWTQDEPVTLEKYFVHVHPDDRERIMTAVRHAHDPKICAPFDIEHRIVRRDGEIRWLSTRAQTFFEGEGEARRPVRTVGAIVDVTDTKKASAELEFANDLLRTQIDNSPDGILVVNADRRVVLFNRRFAELWKIPHEVVAARVDDVILQAGAEQVKDPGEFYARVTYLYDHPDEVANEDIDFKDGRVFERHSTPLHGTGGKYLGRVWIFHDITERKRTEDQIRQLQKTEAIGKLTGGVAHDFNNLLTIVGGNLELLKERLIEEPGCRDLAEKALGAVERGATLTRSLLAFSRQQPLSPRVVDLRRLVQEMADLIRRTVPETIKVAVFAGDDLWPCEADPGQLQNALLNLVANACDAMPEGGRLTIETGNVSLDDEYAATQAGVAPGRYVMLGVSDTGHGMAPEVVARAFDPFFTTKGPGKGTGLGLSMVYGFARQSRGYAKIYSEVGQGSTVRIYLPRSTGVSDEPVQVVPTGDRNGKGETILVVEDDPEVRSLTCSLLRSFGYEVFEAKDSQGALRIADDTPHIALLLVDVVLPGINGPALAAKLQELRPNIKVLFMSGYTENAIIHNGRLDLGVNLLQKPFTKRDLASRVRALLYGSKA